MRFSFKLMPLSLALLASLGTGAALADGVDPAAAAQMRGDRSGARLAQNTCLQCHGMGVAPDLRLQKLDFKTLHHITRNGLNAMPAFREGEISDQELHEVFAYITSLQVQPGTKPGIVPGTYLEREGH
ncbi:c-type cytochrome [Rhodobacter lacus]|uniref:C-type cytochrome n=1 Tax=Rhodobacter lacus TaxID=1641972 RepID=A0ABW5A815_9RHOB